MEVFLHGFATTPEIWPDGGPQLKFDDLHREAERVGRQLETGTTLIGWSMGGMIAMLVAGKFPEKIKDLVLVSTTPKFLSSPDFPAGISPVLLKRLEKRIRTEGTKAFHALIFKDGQPVGVAHLSFEQAREELTELARADLRSELARIKAPTLIIHGDRDEICLPAAAQYLHANIRKSELVILPGIGHAPLIEAPAKINALLAKYAG
ncbi:MAG: alpha/beta hydrolase [Candidatus Margulisbacteria bacterium]|jgi:pimeloyl-[acyl-carrier protein] methyl ester esterase|nr:alpha/beta hydrolase [Candidatus Margulisiibacteriota bacterium]